MSQTFLTTPYTGHTSHTVSSSTVKKEEKKVVPDNKIAPTFPIPGIPSDYCLVEPGDLKDVQPVKLVNDSITKVLVHPLADRSLASGRFGFKGKVFTLRLSRAASLTTSGTGTMQLSTSVLPSQFAEYTQLVDLFTEAKLLSTSIQYSDNQTSVGTVYRCGFISAFQPTDPGTGTVTSLATSRLPGAKLFSLANTTWPVRNSVPKLKGRQWCKITTSGTSADNVSGCAGSWYHSLQNTGPVSTNILFYIIEALYQFRYQD